LLAARHYFENIDSTHLPALFEMPTSLFSAVPLELICRIFELLDNFSDVSALARTGRIFYQTWRKHAMLICRAVGSRSFPNYIEAERLLDCQEKAEEFSQPQDVSQPQGGGEQRSTIHTKRLLSNARCAAAACADWVNFCQIQDTPGAFDRGPEGSPETYMQPSECARFDRTFYSLWTIGVMQNAPHMQQEAFAFLDNCTAQELCRLEEMATWASSYTENDFGTTGLNLRDEVWEAGYDVVSKYWQAYLRENGGMTAAPDAHYTPIGFFAFFNHTQRYLDLYKNR
jgi:hypothetical protein